MNQEEMSKPSSTFLFFIFWSFFLSVTSSFAQQQSSEQTPKSESGTESLQKATQNPVASLISVPLQNNSNFGIGPYDRRFANFRYATNW
jgi:hypothetical protein